MALRSNHNYSWSIHYKKLAGKIAICTSSTTFQEFYADEIEDLPDEFTKNLLLGSLRVLDDEANPPRLHLFAAGLRELFHDLLKFHAPDNEILSSKWCEAHEAAYISKRQRAQFAMQGGILDENLIGLGISMEHLNELRQMVVDTINDANTLLHFQVRELISDPKIIESTASSFLDVLFQFLQTIEECKRDISRTIENHVLDALNGSLPDKIHNNRDREITKYLVPLWGAIEDQKCEVTGISSTDISIRFTADVEIDVETTGMSSFYSQNGIFPVVLEYTASVDDVSKLNLVCSKIDEDAPVWLQDEDQREQQEMHAEIARLVDKDRS